MRHRGADIGGGGDSHFGMKRYGAVVRSLRPDALSPHAVYRFVTERPGIAITFLYYALLISLGFASAVLGPAIPTLAAHTGSTLEGIAWLFTARAFGSMAGAFLLGRLYERYPGHRLMSTAILTLVPVYALTPFIGHLGTLLSLVALSGVCEGTLHVGFNTLLVRLHRERVAPFMNGLHFSFGVGATSAPLLLGVSFDLGGGIIWPYVGIAAIIALLIPFLLRFPTPQGTAAADAATTLPPPHRLLPVLLGLLFFFYAGVEGSLGGWIYTYALDTGIADEASAAWLTSFFWGGLTMGRLAGIVLSRRFAPRHILLADLLGGAVMLVWIILSGGSFYSLAIGAMAYGFAIASIFPTAMAFAGIRMTLTGNITAWFFVGGGSGGMLFPWLVGQMFVNPGPESMLIVAGGSLVMALAVYGGMMFLERGMKNPPPMTVARSKK